VQYTQAGHISFLPPSVVVDPVSERVSSEDSIPESRLTADGGGIGCGWGLLALTPDPLAPSRLLGEEFKELAAEEQPDEEELELVATEEVLLMVEALEAGGGLAKLLALLLSGGWVIVGAAGCPICETALHRDPRADFSGLASLILELMGGGMTALAALLRRRLCTISSCILG